MGIAGRRFHLGPAAFFAGAVFFWFVLRSFGFSETLGVIRRAGLPVLAVFFFYPLMTLWDVGAWRLLFTRQNFSSVRFWDLFWIRLAGEALNNVTPFVDIGGEPLKMRFVAERFGLSTRQAAASTVIAKTSILISEAVFMAMGAVLSFELLPLAPKHRFQILILLLAVCFIFSAFLWLQQRGVFQKMNPEIGFFYSTEGDLFWSAVSLNWMGWIFGGIETYFFCRLAGVDISIMEGVMLEALLQLVRAGTFFIPMNLGAQEGGLAFFMALMGHPPVTGVGISLLKRFRQILWTLTGFAVWVVYEYAESKKTTGKK